MLQTYYPEMGEARPEAQIEASLGHYGKHWYLRTDERLHGRGITYLGQLTADMMCGPRADYLAGMHKYRVTEAAFERLCRQYMVSTEILL